MGRHMTAVRNLGNSVMAVATILSLERIMGMDLRNAMPTHPSALTVESEGLRPKRLPSSSELNFSQTNKKRSGGNGGNARHSRISSRRSKSLLNRQRQEASQEMQVQRELEQSQGRHLKRTTLSLSTTSDEIITTSLFNKDDINLRDFLGQMKLQNFFSMPTSQPSSSPSTMPTQSSLVSKSGKRCFVKEEQNGICADEKGHFFDTIYNETFVNDIECEQECTPFIEMPGFLGYTNQKDEGYCGCFFDNGMAPEPPEGWLLIIRGGVAPVEGIVNTIEDATCARYVCTSFKAGKRVGKTGKRDGKSGKKGKNTQDNCDSPPACKSRLLDRIYDVSNRVGTVQHLSDPNSPQSLATEWILDECESSETPIDPCDIQQIPSIEQRYALAVMYFSLGGDGWKYGAQYVGAENGAWLSSLNYCDWGADIYDSGFLIGNQLECDQFGNVLRLNLYSNWMIGQIALEIGVLVYLESYISFSNYIIGSIPTSLGLITSLATFDVEDNQMEGDLFQKEYMGLKNIVNWRTSFNNFGGGVPTEIGEWTKLKSLWFARNKVTGSVPTEVGNCVEMDSFLIYENNIEGTIPMEIGNMNLLTQIDLEQNSIVGTIPSELYSNLNLEIVILRNNLLSGTVSDDVGDLSHLRQFWASNNELTGSIPSTIGSCTNLVELELQNNNLKGPIPTDVASWGRLNFFP